MTINKLPNFSKRVKSSTIMYDHKNYDLDSRASVKNEIIENVWRSFALIHIITDNIT
jgi:hypothetical protein